MSLELAKSRINMGPSRPTLYQIDLPKDTPTRLGVSKDVKEYVQYFARDISIPSVSHEVMPVMGQSYMGINRLHPTAMKFVGNQFMTTIIENSNFTVYEDLRRLFDKVGHNFNPTENGSRTQRLKFYDEYTFNVVVKKLENPDSFKRMGRYIVDSSQADHGYKVVAEFIFNKCYVAKMGEISLGSDAFDSMTTYSVTFNYETYEYRYLGQGDVTKYSHMDRK